MNLSMRAETAISNGSSGGQTDKREWDPMLCSAILEPIVSFALVSIEDNIAVTGRLTLEQNMWLSAHGKFESTQGPCVK